MCSFTSGKSLKMCFHGQKTQPTLISGDKMSEAGTDKTLPILEQVIKNHQNLPKPNSTPYICLSGVQRNVVPRL